MLSVLSIDSTERVGNRERYGIHALFIRAIQATTADLKRIALAVLFGSTVK